MLLEATGISKHFDGVAAVDHATLTVEQGTITALIGPNGAGKTTVFNMLSGFLKVDSGQIIFDGQRVDGRRPHAIVRTGLVRTFQAPRILTRMSVLENVMLAAPDQPGEHLMPAILRKRSAIDRERKVEQTAREVLDLVHLDHLAGDYAGTLSGGQRKLLEFGRALMTSPKLLLLDEPMAGVAPNLAIQLLERVQDIRERGGVTIFIIEHDMEVVMGLSDRVIVMDEGKVVADGPPATIQNNQRVIEAYLGRIAMGPESDGPQDFM
jgi:ABC-type branched-subunit amino acid transport system ATPase component